MAKVSQRHRKCSGQKLDCFS